MVSRELGDRIRIGTEALEPRMGGLDLEEQQDADEAATTSTSASAASGSGSLPI